MDTNEILELLLYFIIYSFLGWVLESVCKTIWEKKFVNSGFLHGPFCPIYGAGAIIMIVFLSHFKDNIFSSLCRVNHMGIHSRSTIRKTIFYTLLGLL